MVGVVKASGQKEAFNEEKVITSIQRARVPRELRQQALAHVKEKLYEGIPTTEIYHHVSEFLGTSSHPYAKAAYSLKQAIMQLGPTGYPFEDFIARILSEIGYTTQVRQIMQGRCVSHEIDIVAQKDGRKSLIEAKFHNSPGTRSDVHVPMYTKSRFDDVKEKFALNDAWIITNTKTTVDAIAFAGCIGMKVLSWSYPEGKSLRDLIEEVHLHPVTMLTTISESQIQTLLENHIIMCKDICDDDKLLDVLHLAPEVKNKTMDEIRFICRSEE